MNARSYAVPVKRLLRLGAACLALVAAAAAWRAWSPESKFAEVRADGTEEVFPIRTPIDRMVLEKMRENKVDPSPACTDEEFCRRAYLDVVGMIPTPVELRKFLGDHSSDKRAKLVDQLLQDERYGNKWEAMWGDLLREHTGGSKKEGTTSGSFREWIKESLNANMPYDTFTKSLICASGRAEDNGAVNFYLRDEMNRVETVNMISADFMGTRMACAQCHDHPFDKWEQKDFQGLMAFLNRVSLKVDPWASLANMKDAKLPPDVMKILEPHIRDAEKRAPGEGEEPDAGAGKLKKKSKSGTLGEIFEEVESKLGKKKADELRKAFQANEIKTVHETSTGEYHMPTEGDSAKKKSTGGEVVVPEFPWDPNQKVDEKLGRRASLANFVAGSRRFAEVQANRLWQQLLGRGLVSPTDDFREKNPPTNPELLAYLADEFVRLKFDNKAMIKLIMSSSVYDRSSAATAGNKDDKTWYSHYPIHRMTAEQVFDSLLIATGRTHGLSDLGSVKEAMKEMDSEPGKKKKSGKPPKEAEWAGDLPTPAAPGSFMNLFNQSDRGQIATERDQEGSISQALEMLNGQALNGVITAKPGSLSYSLISQKKDAEAIATELYLATLSRNPTAEELATARAVLHGSPPDAQAVEDFHWALLNTREFLFVK